MDNVVCEVCDQEGEIGAHVIMGGPFAKEFWARIGFPLPLVNSGMVGEIHNVQCLANIPQKHFSTFVALCCWQLWKRRNGVIFRSERASHHKMLAACITLMWSFGNLLSILLVSVADMLVDADSL